jgi:hypothetical protein
MHLCGLLALRFGSVYQSDELSVTWKCDRWWDGHMNISEEGDV